MKRDKLFEECLAKVPPEVIQQVSNNIDKIMSKEKVIIPSTKLKCDKCGEYFDDGEGGMCIPYDTDGSEIEECALEDGWVEKDGKHYCPKCKK